MGAKSIGAEQREGERLQDPGNRMGRSCSPGWRAGPREGGGEEGRCGGTVRCCRCAVRGGSGHWAEARGRVCRKGHLEQARVRTKAG